MGLDPRQVLPNVGTRFGFDTVTVLHLMTGDVISVVGINRPDQQHQGGSDVEQVVKPQIGRAQPLELTPARLMLRLEGKCHRRPLLC